MPRFVTGLFLASLCAVSAASVKQAAPATTKPNVVLIIADDVRYGYFGSDGGRLTSRRRTSTVSLETARS